MVLYAAVALGLGALLFSQARRLSDRVNPKPDGSLATWGAGLSL